jgi:hypothetical protein
LVTHTLAPGGVGLVTSVLGLRAIVKGDLAPARYGRVLILLTLPVTWLRGYFFVLQQGQD